MVGPTRCRGCLVVLIFFLSRLLFLYFIVYPIHVYMVLDRQQEAEIADRTALINDHLDNRTLPCS